jgi:VIT1/CCC1 family predicted Fe2+/Mn2+ transporter
MLKESNESIRNRIADNLKLLQTQERRRKIAARVAATGAGIAMTLGVIDFLSPMPPVPAYLVYLAAAVALVELSVMFWRDAAQ